MLGSSRELRELRVFLHQLSQRVRFMWRGQPFQQLRLDCHGLIVHLDLRAGEFSLAVANSVYRAS